MKASKVIKMILNEYKNKDGFRIVLNDDERRKVLSKCNDKDVCNTWILASFCGLRRAEIGSLRYGDILRRDGGDYVVRIKNGKGDKYRETPIPDKYAYKLRAEQEADNKQDTDKIIDKSMRHISRRFGDVVDSLDDDRYKHVTLHDGRRTWANALLDQGVQPLQVMEWGGWADWQTFRDHYLTEFTEKKQKEEIEKVDWI